MGAGPSSSSADWQVNGLGSSLDEIQQKAKDEGQTNLVIWAGYADKSWADEFTKQTGCKVITKDGASSDDMVDLMATGAYDGVSASGDATLRLIAKGDVAPVNFDLLPNYADVFDGLEGPVVQHGRRRRLRRSPRPRPEPARLPERRPAEEHGQLGVRSGTAPQGKKLSIYDNPIFIADAAVYLKATQPDLKITNPYELDDTQFNAAVDLLKKQKADIAKYWDGVTYADQVTTFKSGETTVGTTWPYQVNLMAAEKPPLDGVVAEAEGGHDGLVGHVDDLHEGRASELHVPLDELHHLAAGEREGGGVLRRGPVEREGVRLHDRQELLHEVPRNGRRLVEGRLLLEHRAGRLRRRPRRRLQDVRGLARRLDGHQGVAPARE